MAFYLDELAAALETQLADADSSLPIPVSYGELSLHEHKTAPRVVLLHRGGLHRARAVEPQQEETIDGDGVAVIEPASYSIDLLRANCYGRTPEQAHAVWQLLCGVLVEQWENKGLQTPLGAFNWRTEDPSVASQALREALIWQDFGLMLVVPASPTEPLDTIEIEFTHPEGFLEDGTEDGAQCDPA